MKRVICLFTIIFALMIVVPAAFGLPYLVIEPNLNTRLEWNLTANGMLFAGYDLDRNGKADFYAMRIVLRSYYSAETVFSVAKNSPNNLVFFVNYGPAHYYYIAAKKPLFYGVDVNEDGHWDIMYKDVSEDGVNGNERFYESPSGMFTLENLSVEK